MTYPREFSTAVVIPRLFKRKDGVIKVQFYGLAGIIPSRNFSSPQIVEDDGFILGKKYEVIVIEIAPDKSGRRFRWVSAGEWEGGLISARKAYGLPVVMNVEREEDFVSIGSDKSINVAKPVN